MFIVISGNDSLIGFKYLFSYVTFSIFFVKTLTFQNMLILLDGYVNKIIIPNR